MKYLIKVVETYRLPTVEAAQDFHAELENDTSFVLVAFSTKTKQIKEKKEVVEEYQLVTATKVFNNEKEPERAIKVTYAGA